MCVPSNCALHSAQPILPRIACRQRGTVFNIGGYIAICLVSRNHCPPPPQICDFCSCRSITASLDYLPKISSHFRVPKTLRNGGVSHKNCLIAVTGAGKEGRRANVDITLDVFSLFLPPLRALRKTAIALLA